MSFSASSFQAVPPPNYAAYANPGLGTQLGQMIAQVPDAFVKAREQGRTIAKQDAFKEGMPVLKDADGNPVTDQNGNPIPDVNAIVNTGFRLGGYDYAAGMMPYLQGQDVSALQGRIDAGVQGFGGEPAANPRPDNGATGPGHLTLPPPAASSAAATAALVCRRRQSRPADHKQSGERSFWRARCDAYAPPLRRGGGQ
jgi:hypothetical protein